MLVTKGLIPFAFFQGGMFWNILLEEMVTVEYSGEVRTALKGERKSGTEMWIYCVICPSDGRMDSELLSSFLC